LNGGQRPLAAAPRSKFGEIGMSRIECFEDIEAWKRARELIREIYAMSEKGPLSRDYSFKDQIRRASVSIMSNIAEGFERGSNKEFIQFLYIAKGSAGEVRSQLYIALDQHYVDQESFDTMIVLIENVSRKLSGLIAYLTQSEKKGAKR
jgi:four helix bundle protein